MSFIIKQYNDLFLNMKEKSLYKDMKNHLI